MKLAFTGDICFGDMEKFTNNPFKNIITKLSKFNCIVSLEAVFLPKSYTEYPIKPKVCLRQHDETIEYLIQLNPFLVNLSNNHIHDYGNFGANNTMKQLASTNLNYFGAGYSNQNHNIFISKKEKIIFLSYTTRSIDETGSRLFDEASFIGPKEFSFELVEKQIENYKTFTKIVLFHWGIEDVNYPLPEQRDIAKNLIDIGIDLIVGNHSHVVQSYEQYKGKWIFYCLGHFFFPDFISHYIKDGNIKTFLDIHSEERKTSIIPVFDIKEQNVILNNIYTIVANDRFEPQFINKKVRHNIFLFKNNHLYKLFYKSHMANKLFYRLLRRIYKKIKTSTNRIRLIKPGQIS